VARLRRREPEIAARFNRAALGLVSVDILPSLKGGDSYQLRASAWILSVGFCSDGLSSPEDGEQTIEAMPNLLILIAPTQSACAEKPPARQTTSLCDLPSSLATCSQHGQNRLLFCGRTSISNPPRHTVLYSS
jgi:hypothetical protein